MSPGLLAGIVTFTGIEVLVFRAMVDAALWIRTLDVSLFAFG